MNAATIAAIALAVPEAVGAERARVERRATEWGRESGYNSDVGHYIRTVLRVAAPAPQGTAVPAAAPVAVPDTSEDEQTDRTCECESCDDTACDGTCDACDDRDCQQCHGDCDSDCTVCHYLYECCGYCEHCDNCHGPGRDNVCDQDYCHECEHSCGR